MKNVRLLCLLTFTLAFGTASLVWAQDNNQNKSDWTHVTGTAEAAAGQQHGNDTVGGVSSGDAVATYDASGKCTSNCGTSGTANANAKATGSDASTPTSFKTNSGVGVNSLAQSNGQKNKDSVKGTAQQANWGFVGNDANGAGGSNTTDGSYQGKINSSKNGDPTISGKANSGGMTTGTVATTDNSNAAAVRSTGFSNAKLAPGNPRSSNPSCPGQKPSGTVRVSGQGAIGAVSTMGGGPNDNSFAGASMGGTTVFSADGKQAASGSQALTGSTKSTITPTSASSSATVTSTAKTTGH